MLFRGLLQRELPALQWGAVFRALRVMELGGEVLAGHFFAGIPGLQFISVAAYRRLTAGMSEDALYWVNAADPASLCGVDVVGLKSLLPARHATTYLAFQGARLTLVARRGGKDLTFHLADDHPDLGRHLDVLRHLLTRGAQPASSIDVETINDEPALDSPYVGRLAESFRITREPKTVKLWKRYE
ncbi:MAG: hypothetical protein AAGD38_17845 [Acidobacteriota bacterium]